MANAVAFGQSRVEHRNYVILYDDVVERMRFYSRNYNDRRRDWATIVVRVMNPPNAYEADAD